jgi:hypothetical protein
LLRPGIRHTTIGLRWILPNLTKESLPSTPLGSSWMTLDMVRLIWHMVSVLLVGFGILFVALAWAPDADPKTLLLRWFAARCGLLRRWLAGMVAAVRAASCGLPVPLAFVVIAVLCWTAST